jgi:hypothetical protein
MKMLAKYRFIFFIIVFSGFQLLVFSLQILIPKLIAEN